MTPKRVLIDSIAGDFKDTQLHLIWTYFLHKPINKSLRDLDIWKSKVFFLGNYTIQNLRVL